MLACAMASFDRSATSVKGVGVQVDGGPMTKNTQDVTRHQGAGRQAQRRPMAPKLYSKGWASAEEEQGQALAIMTPMKKNCHSRLACGGGRNTGAGAGASATSAWPLRWAPRRS